MIIENNMRLITHDIINLRYISRICGLTEDDNKHEAEYPISGLILIWGPRE